MLTTRSQLPLIEALRLNTIATTRVLVSHTQPSPQEFIEKIKGAYLGRKNRLLSESIDGIFILGHTAVGKSRLLESFHLDRVIHDLDLFCGNNGHSLSVELLKQWVNGTPCNPNIRVLSNDIVFIKDLVSCRDDFNSLFVYVRKDRSIIFENIHKVNTDGCRHVIPKDLNRWYDLYEHYYLKLADVIVHLYEDQE